MPKKKKTRRAWLPEDEAQLRWLYGMTPVDEIARIMGRTSESITAKASRMGITTGERIRPRKVRYWTDHQVAQLKRLYISDVQIDEIAYLMDRTEESVKCKASELGVAHRNPRPWTEDELVQMRGCYATLGAHKLSRILGRSYVSVKMRAYLMGLKRDKEKP